MWLIVASLRGHRHCPWRFPSAIFAGILCVSFFANMGASANDASFLLIVAAAMILILVALAIALIRSVSRRVGLRPRHTCSGALDLPVRCCELARAGRPDVV